MKDQFNTIMLAHNHIHVGHTGANNYGFTDTHTHIHKQ